MAFSIGKAFTKTRAAMAAGIAEFREKAAAADAEGLTDLAASLNKQADEMQAVLDSESAAHVLTVVYGEIKRGETVIVHRPEDLF